jgi:hypothetical protein
MARSTLTIAAAALVLPTLFASTAQACISCEYTPEVARSSSTTYEGPRSYSYERAYTVQRDYEPRRSKHIAKEIERPAKKVRKIDTAKTDDDKPAPVQAAAAAPVKTEAAAPEKVATIATVTVEQKPAENENSSISGIATKVAEAEAAPAKDPQPEVAAAKPVGCKKFFPAVGMTVSVTCE